MSQYLAICEATLGLIALNCELWMAAGLATFLSIPIMWIGFCYYMLRKHILGDRARFIHFKSLSWNRIRSKLSMGQGFLGKIFACYMIFLHFIVRGEWQYEPEGGSPLWSFLMQEYVGDVWFYALTRLFKKVAMSAVLSLTDGMINAILAITLASCDMICVLSLRPYIARHVDIAECVAAIFNTMAIIMLGIPVLAPSLAPYSSDLVAICLMLVSVLVSLAPVLPGIVLDIIELLRNVFRVAGASILNLFYYLAGKSEEELRERMRLKYMQDLDFEQKSVRLQMMLESPQSMLTRPSKVEPKGFVQKIFRKVGVATAEYECPLVYLRQAISFVVGVGVYDVSIMYCDGPSIFTLEQQYEDRALAFCRQPTHSGNSEIVNCLLVSKFHVQDPKLLDACASYHPAGCYDSARQGNESTTLLDIIVTIDDAQSAQKVVARLQEDTVLDSLRNHDVHFPAHVLRPAAIQQNFFPAGFVLHPLTQSPAAAVIQRICRQRLVPNDFSDKSSAAAVIQRLCRRRLILNDFSDDSFLRTLFGVMPPPPLSSVAPPPASCSSDSTEVGGAQVLSIDKEAVLWRSFNSPDSSCGSKRAGGANKDRGGGGAKDERVGGGGRAQEEGGLNFYKSGLGYKSTTTRAYTSNRNTSEIKSFESKSSIVFKPQTDRLLTFWEMEDQERKVLLDQNGKVLQKSIAVNYHTSSSHAGSNVHNIKTDIKGDYAIVDVALIADGPLERPIHLRRRGADVESALYSPRNMDHMVSSLSLSLSVSLPPPPPPPLNLLPVLPSPSPSPAQSHCCTSPSPLPLLLPLSLPLFLSPSPSARPISHLPPFSPFPHLPPLVLACIQTRESATFGALSLRACMRRLHFISIRRMDAMAFWTTQPQKKIGLLRGPLPGFVQETPKKSGLQRAPAAGPPTRAPRDASL
jgi:hypothetical protein